MREREKDRERERKGKRPLKVDTFLSAPDLLARHLLVRRDSVVPGTPTGQGNKTYLHWWCTCCVKASLNLIKFCGSFDAALQGRRSHTQRSDHLQGDSLEAWGCDQSGEPLPFPVP